MAYLRPPAFTQRVFNPLAMRFGFSGASTLAIRGRVTGEPRRVPVIAVESDGARYLVSTRGESEWVRNLRAAAGQAELHGRGAPEPVQATEIPVEDRPPVIAAYRAVTGKMGSSYFATLPEPADHPVFRIQSRDG